MDPYGLAVATVAFLMGGILKGAVGAGSPVVAVPILSMLYGVPFAVSVFVLPNLISNLWQGWQYRKHLVSPKFVVVFACAGATGAGVGSVLLSALPADFLMRIVAFIVLGYVAFRLTRPAWSLSDIHANRLVALAGFIGGVLQGAGGISAPVSVTFLNALKMERSAFIATISIFFVAMSVVQIPTLIGFGILTPNRLLFSVFALIPLLGGMPIGAWIARRVQPEVFNKLVLALLLVVALKLIFLPQ
jgi:uncharacterized membrane protein YfcA